jgi:hypothetical protein
MKGAICALALLMHMYHPALMHYSVKYIVTPRIIWCIEV